MGADTCDAQTNPGWRSAEEDAAAPLAGVGSGRARRELNAATTTTAQNPAVPTPFGWSDWLLHLYAVFTTIAVLVLISIGGMVTSKGAGLAVPDWPNSYGYNMFAFPISRWVGGIFWEHFHRLSATGIGLLTIGLCVWLRRQDKRAWMHWLGYAAVGAVVFQGVLGGLRVVLRADWIGIFHACFAQAFILLIGFVALATSRWWRQAPRLAENRSAADAQTLRALQMAFFVLAGLIYLQLALGASMRHAHAGLSIRDFPLAYGKLWPDTDPATIDRINQERAQTLGMPRTSAGQILLQMFHRIGAGVIALSVCAAAAMTRRRRAALPKNLTRLGLAGPYLIALQIALGIYTIWTNKAADVTTLHVVVGATSLIWATMMAAALSRWNAGPFAEARTIQEDMIPQSHPRTLASPQPREAVV